MASNEVAILPKTLETISVNASGVSLFTFGGTIIMLPGGMGVLEFPEMF